MILGIDVGGTHTDAVLIENLNVKRKAKVLTEAQNLIGSLVKVTHEILRDEDRDKLDRISLSTTLSTNAIVQGNVNRVGMILASGPGMAPDTCGISEDAHFVSGYVNHRGMEIMPVRDDEIGKISRRFQERGIQHVGIVGKFSTRNPGQELAIQRIIHDGFRHVSLGHRMSGLLNFPRRASTTYLNAAVWDLYAAFAGSIRGLVATIGRDIPIYILKADGGTCELERSLEFPIQTILSGPAASIMGVLSLTDCRTDAVALDIGGTTTDIALFAEGVPLLEPLGVTIGGRKTLIRGLRTRSIGAGGDSVVTLDEGQWVIGPERKGPAAAFGGADATPTDAMVVLGLADAGDRKRAEQAVQAVAKTAGLSLKETAEEIFDRTCRKIASSVRELIEDVNREPVYTIHEMLEGRTITPRVIFVVGGPAGAVASRLSELLECPAEIPGHADVANAIGAAMSRTTAEMTVIADTALGLMTVVEEGLQQTISPGFTRRDAQQFCTEKLKEQARRMGGREEDLEIEITEDQEFNMVRGTMTTGKNIRVKAQIKPGLLTGSKKGDRIR